MFPPIVINRFNGLMPKRDRRMLPAGYATLSLNCDYRSGAIRPRRLSLPVGQNKAGHTGLAIDADRNFHSVPVPCYHARWRRRTIVSGSGAPYYIEDGAAAAEYPLGIPAAGYSLSANITASGSSGDTVNVIYAISIRNRHGDQSYLFPATPVSPSGTLRFDGNVRLTITRTAAADELTFDESGAVIEIWATNRTAGGGGGLFYIGEIPAPTTADATFIDRGAPDVAADGTVNTPSTRRQEQYNLYSGEGTAGDIGPIQPAPTMKKIIAMPGDFLVGHDGERVWFSEIGRAATWPKEYAWPHLSAPPQNIVGIETNVDNLYIFRRDEAPIVITMTVPGVRENQLPFYTTIPWPCISADSIVNTGHGIFYATRSGLVALQGARGELITKEIWDRRTFAEWLPEQLRCFTWDGVLMGSSPAGAFILDPQAANGWSLTVITERPSDAKEYDGDLYYVENDEIYQLEGGLFNHTAIWHSGVVRMTEPVNAATAQVRANYRAISVACHLGGIGTVGIGPDITGRFAAGIGQTEGDIITAQIPPSVGVELQSDEPSVSLAKWRAHNGKPTKGFHSVKHDEYVVCITTNTEVDSFAIAANDKDLQTAVS